MNDEDLVLELEDANVDLDPAIEDSFDYVTAADVREAISQVSTAEAICTPIQTAALVAGAVKLATPTVLAATMAVGMAAVAYDHYHKTNNTQKVLGAASIAASLASPVSLVAQTALLQPVATSNSWSSRFLFGAACVASCVVRNPIVSMSAYMLTAAAAIRAQQDNAPVATLATEVLQNAGENARANFKTTVKIAQNTAAAFRL
jgi:hypothetical protein